MKPMLFRLGTTCLISLCIGISAAQAAIGGSAQNSVNYTTSTQTITHDTYTPLSQIVDQYSTEIKAILNGSTVVYDQTFALAYNDPSVQAAIQAANAILSADKAAFGTPSLSYNNTSLVSSVSVNSAPVTTASKDSVVTTSYIGPQTVMVGENQTFSFYLSPGQIDYDTLLTTDVFRNIDVVTTNTNLTTQCYRIDGSTAVPTVPDTGSSLLLLSGSLAILGWFARSSSSRRG